MSAFSASITAAIDVPKIAVMPATVPATSSVCVPPLKCAVAGNACDLQRFGLLRPLRGRRVCKHSSSAAAEKLRQCRGITVVKETRLYCRCSGESTDS